MESEIYPKKKKRSNITRENVICVTLLKSKI